MATDSDLTYANTSDLAKALLIFRSIPSWDVGDSPTNEAVGIGNDSDTVFYLDHKNTVFGSYTIYANAVAMTETTDYTLELDTGKITLTSAGVTELSTNNLTAKYDWIDLGTTVSYLADVLLRAEKELNGMLNTIFTDGTATNPTYPSVTEIQSSEGFYQDRILTRKRPLKDITTTINGAHNDSITTISLAAGTGTNFPSNGSVVLNSEVISYTGVSTDDLTGCTRATQGTTAAAHSDGDDIHTTIFFRSDTAEGSAVAWAIQPWNTSMYGDEFGLIYKFKDVSPDPLLRLGVSNRIKIIYYHGHDTIPEDIKRLTILLGKRMLIRDNIGKALIVGRDEFQPEMFNVDKDEIDLISGTYIVLPMGNT